MTFLGSGDGITSFYMKRSEVIRTLLYITDKMKQQKKNWYEDISWMKSDFMKFC